MFSPLSLLLLLSSSIMAQQQARMISLSQISRAAIPFYPTKLHDQYRDVENRGTINLRHPVTGAHDYVNKIYGTTEEVQDVLRLWQRVLNYCRMAHLDPWEWFPKIFIEDEVGAQAWNQMLGAHFPAEEDRNEDNIVDGARHWIDALFGGRNAGDKQYKYLETFKMLRNKEIVRWTQRLTELYKLTDDWMNALERPTPMARLRHYLDNLPKISPFDYVERIRLQNWDPLDEANDGADAWTLPTAASNLRAFQEIGMNSLNYVLNSTLVEYEERKPRGHPRQGSQGGRSQGGPPRFNPGRDYGNRNGNTNAGRGTGRTHQGRQGRGGRGGRGGNHYQGRGYQVCKLPGHNESHTFNDC
jgi:hypothetical protein